MNRTARSALWVLGAAAVGLLAAGCGYTDEGTRAPKRFYQLPQGWEEAFAHYPRGVVSESVLMIRKTGPKDIVANQDFEYVIEVYNPTDKVLLKNVLIRDYMAPGVRIRSSTPTWEYIDARREEGEWIPDLWKAGKDIDDKAAPAPAIESSERRPDAPRSMSMPQIRWHISELLPEKMVTIRVKARATEAGTIVNCATAEYEIAACIQSRVTAPALALRLAIPPEFIICTTDTTELTYTVTNTGSGVAKGVVVTSTLPEGLTANGQRQVSLQVGDVPAGQSKSVKATVRVARPGDYSIRGTAKAGDLSAEGASVAMQVRQGQISLAARGPEMEYVGLPVEYTIQVTNVGTARTRELVIEDQIPPGMEFVDATAGGKVEGSKVVWRFERIEPTQVQTVSVRFRGREAGTVRNVVTARGICTGDLSEILTTELQGVPAMLLEVIDHQDPNKVGEEEVYTITVTNQGSAPENNVIVHCEIEDAMEFVSAKGATATAAKPRAKTVTFAPVPSIAPKQSVTFEVTVRCVRPGDIRFHVEVTSDEHGRPVRETEATSIYD